MVDQKQLREMMKREKEQRAKAKPATAVTGRPRPGQRIGAAPVVAATSATRAVAAQPQRKLDSAPAATRPAAQPRAESRQNSEVQRSTAPASTSLVGGYDADSDEEVEPETKRARVESVAAPDAKPSSGSSAMPPPPVPVAKRADAAADALAMPPPALPPRASKVPTAGASSAALPETSSSTAAPAAGGVARSSSSAVALRGEEDEDLPLAPSPMLGEIQLAATPAGSSEGSNKEADGSIEGEDADAAPDLPEGFFDDPEQDAKARGVEAPSVIAQRELEEGLKRFEKEMAIEKEKAEEVRHEIDEAKYEQAAAEEEEFQRSLQGRLALLRKQSAEKAAIAAVAKAAAEKKAAEERMAAAEAEGGDDADSDDSDVDFDWRAKHFG